MITSMRGALLSSMRGALLSLLAFGGLLAQSAPVGRVHRHPAGFQLRLPAGWTAENGPDGVLLSPPGVKVDPDREDNPEVYTASPAEGLGIDDPAMLEDFQSQFAGSGIVFLKTAERSAFSAAERSGTLLLWEFRHPATKKLHQVRLYLRQDGGKVLALAARGDKSALEKRDWPLRLIAASLGVPAPPAVKAAAVPRPSPPPAAAAAKSAASTPPPVSAAKPAAPAPAPAAASTAAPRTGPAPPGSGPWEARLSGKLLKPLSGGPGIHLRADGSYAAPGEETAAGRWRIRNRGSDTMLELAPSGGQPSFLILRMAGNTLVVGGVAHSIEALR